ncbi:MAG: hypothetical protein ABR536_02345 [Solirubrobacterales bacterium]
MDAGAETGNAIEVLDQGRRVAFTFEDMVRYHGRGSPGGVAHAFKVLERAVPLLEPGGPPERRGIIIRTPFGGPGARDGFELVTRAVSEDRYRVDPELARPERGRALERFVFVLSYLDSSVTLVLREGYVSDEFISLARKEQPGPEDDRRLALLKDQMADLVMSKPPEEVYDAEGPGL